MISGGAPIMEAMQAQQLKSLVEEGRYKPDPALVASAMLSRRGVRDLLMSPGRRDGRADRTQPPPAAPRQAA